MRSSMRVNERRKGMTRLLDIKMRARTVAVQRGKFTGPGYLSCV